MQSSNGYYLEQYGEKDAGRTHNSSFSETAIIGENSGQVI